MQLYIGPDVAPEPAAEEPAKVDPYGQHTQLREVSRDEWTLIAMVRLFDLSNDRVALMLCRLSDEQKAKRSS